MVTISPETVFGLILGILIPGLFWAWRVSAQQKKTLDNLASLTAMHLDEDSVFSTTKTNELLGQHMKQEQDMHRATVDALNALNRTIAELTHYIQWSTSQQLGKEAPPYVGE